MSAPAASPVVLRAQDHRRMAWANGGGTTYQVAAWPEGAGTDAFDWRVSLADVDTEGPFSSFPGVDRVLVVLDGPGMDLVVDGRPVPARPHSPVSFPGDAVTSCRLLDGPTTDLNVMTRRGRCTASVAVVPLGPALEVVPEPGSTVLVVVVAGEAAVHGEDVPPLGPRDVLVPAGAPVALLGDAVLAVVTLRSAAG